MSRVSTVPTPLDAVRIDEPCIRNRIDDAFLGRTAVLANVHATVRITNRIPAAIDIQFFVPYARHTTAPNHTRVDALAIVDNGAIG